MRTTSYAGVLLFFLAMPICWAGQSASDSETLPPKKPTTAEEIATLVEELGHKHYTKRERATASLQLAGMDARPQLEEAAKSDNLEIRYRANRLLGLIAEQVYRDLITAFLNGDSKATLPGWTNCSDVLGDSLPARQLFAEMHRAERGLMEIYDRDPAEAGQLLLHRFNSGGYNNESLSLGTMATLLLLAADGRVNFPQHALSQLQWALSNSRIHQAPSFKKDGMLRKLASITFGKPCSALDRHASDLKLRMLIEFQLTDEAVQLAVDSLNELAAANIDPQTWADHRAYFLHTLGRFGNQSHIPLIEASLDDTSTMPSDVQVRDVALTVLIHLSGQDHSDYGLSKPFLDANWHGETSWERLHVLEADERDAAVERWCEWSVQNLNSDSEPAAK